MRPSALSLLAAVFLAACDSAAPSKPSTDSPGTGLRSFQISGLPVRLDVEIATADTIALDAAFGPSKPADLSLAVGYSGAAITLLQRAPTLVVQAVAFGEAEVIFTARAAGYRDTTVSIPVGVFNGTCPPERPAGARDFFPVTDGTTWTFVIRRTLTHLGSTSIVTGVTTATFRVEYCSASTRHGVVRYETSSELGGSLEEIPFAENGQNVVSFATPRALLFSNRVSFSRYAVTPEPTLRVPLQLCNTSPFVEFGDGRGLTLEHYGCGSPGGRTESRTLIRQP